MSIDIKQLFIDLGQGHLFLEWESLSEKEQLLLLDQLAQFGDPAALLTSVKAAISLSKSNLSSTKEVEPLPKDSYACLLDERPEQISQWETEGLRLVNNGEVGVILMAGGQGSRLGSSSPKGCYDINLPSHKSLFQLHLEKIRKIVELSNEKFGNNNGRIAFYIMTSLPTRKETEDFFQSNKYFGLLKEDVIFFNQGTLPVFTEDGDKLYMETKSSICESPDGNGGFYKAIHKSNLLQDFSERKIKYIHMFCVDNCLAKVADPVFIGWSKLNNYDLSTKVVRKRNATEKVGLIVLDQEKQCPCVIEYSEISQELSEKLNPDGSLYLRSANIVNHCYSVELLEREIEKWILSQEYLPFHIAHKKIPHYDTTTGQFVKPEEPNGIKLEQFIFDVFPAIPLSRFGCMEVDRTEEFSPLKNGPGSANDCPETARLHSLQLGTKWVVASGGKLVSEDALVEVSPLSSYAGEGLHDKVNGHLFKDGDIV